MFEEDPCGNEEAGQKEGGIKAQGTGGRSAGPGDDEDLKGQERC